MKKDKLIIVTGGLGFIGSNLIAELERRGYRRVTVVDTFGTGDKWKNISRRSNVEEVIHPDELDEYLRSHAEETGAVVHLGAISATTERDVDLLYSNNYLFSRRLYENCRMHDIPLIYASSASVYGSSQDFEDSDTPEKISALRPLNAYGWTKKLTDLYIASDGGFGKNTPQTVGLRFFNVYGPNEYHKGRMASVMLHFWREALENGVIKLFESTAPELADGEQSRDFVHVDDCTALICWLLEHPEVSGIYNVGTGNSVTYNKVARTIFECLGMSPDIHYKEMPADVRAHYQNHTRARMEKLEAAGYPGNFRDAGRGIRDYMKILDKEDKYI